MRTCWVFHTGLACIVSMTMLGCGSNDEEDSVRGRAVTVRGHIESIDESRLSWTGLVLALACEATLEQNGKPIYSAGDEYRKVAIGDDHTFQFDLPAEIESGWYATGPVFSQASCAFDFRAYNDENGNGKLDVAPVDEPNGYDDPQELLCDDTGNGMACGVQFIRDPAFYKKNLGIDVVVGWNYAMGLKNWSSDFDRDFVLNSLTVSLSDGGT